MWPNQVPGSDSSPPCWTVTEPSRPSSVRPVIRSVATYDREPSSVPADASSVVAVPTIPEVNVFAKGQQAEPVGVQASDLPRLEAVDLEARDQRHRFLPHTWPSGS